MEVTRKNFKESLPLVSASIKKADFLVIDAEFTGLINGPEVSVFDSPAEYYLRSLAGCRDFLLIQFGLSSFYWDEAAEHYMNDSYNFYLFPRGRPGPERMFLCQSSSLDFLSSQGFDFNKLIRDGISYMTEPAEAQLRESITKRQKLYSKETNNITIPDENKPQIEEICERVRVFLDEKKTNEMEIDRCNAFIRRLLFQELGTRFKTEAFVESKVLENKNRVLKVTRITAENEGQDRDAQKKEKEWEELEDAIGFSKVARMISQSDKLVVGHNMLLDVLHTLNHFFQPPPPDYVSFKEFAHCMFPKLLDTKYMSSLPPFKDKVNSSVLSHLLATLSEPPFSLPKTGSTQGRGYTLADEKSHEAGYDAFITGLCFLAMHSHLARMRGEQARVNAANASLKPFLNKLFLAKTAHQDSPYMHFTGPDPTPSRDHVFHLTFPSEWQRNDINQLFSPFGPITVHFLDDTSALIALMRREQARDVIRSLAKCNRATLVPYVKYKHMTRKVIQDSKHWRREEEPVTTPDAAKARQVFRANSTQPAESTTVYARSNSTPQPAETSAPISSPNLTERARSISASEAAEMSAPSPPPSRGGRARSISASQNAETEAPSRAARVRSNSASAPVKERSSRKRTSSGVFQVDESEPPPKKPELSRSNSETPRKRSEVNGKRDSDKGAKKEKKVIERFDTEAETKCVTAFKESDSWD